MLTPSLGGLPASRGARPHQKLLLHLLLPLPHLPLLLLPLRLLLLHLLQVLLLLQALHQGEVSSLRCIGQPGPARPSRPIPCTLPREPPPAPPLAGPGSVLPYSPATALSQVQPPSRHPCLLRQRPNHCHVLVQRRLAVHIHSRWMDCQWSGPRHKYQRDSFVLQAYSSLQHRQMRHAPRRHSEVQIKCSRSLSSTSHSFVCQRQPRAAHADQDYLAIKGLGLCASMAGLPARLGHTSYTITTAVLHFVLPP